MRLNRCRFRVGRVGPPRCAVRPADITGWHRDYDPCIWRSRATEAQKRVGWEMWVRMEKVIALILDEAHRLQVKETMEASGEGPEKFYGGRLD